MPRAFRLLLAGPLLLSLALLAPPEAFANGDLEEGDAPDVATLEVGLLVGGGFFQANSPSDPPGAYTFLFGSAFSGGGFEVGLTSLLDFASLPLGIGFDVMVSSMSTSGTAEAGDSSREVELSEIAVRLWVPQARVHVPLPFGQWELGLGPELVFGVATGAVETVENVAPESEAIQTDGGFALFLVGQTGVTFEIDGFGPFDQVAFPILVRAGWNPGYPARTDERFANFDGPDDPGPITVGADWYVTALAGVRFGSFF